jgi:glycosyltransferase involved in cell wall biosynthesis
LIIFRAVVRRRRSGGDHPGAFPWPPPAEQTQTPAARKRIYMAAVVQEAMKGFLVLHEACARLWRKRRDFELLATGEPHGQADEFTRFVGWAAQEDLPRHYWGTDISWYPPSPRGPEPDLGGGDGGGEARGGQPHRRAALHHVDGVTGLLCEPADAADLARKLEVLLDDTWVSQRVGLAGRHRFEQEFAWDLVIDK